jgi:ribosomal protein L16 Arg81 hydroxylase
MADENYGFDWAIAPETPQNFFADYFEKKPLIIRRADQDYYKKLLSYDDIDQVITTMGLSAPEINVTRADANITTSDFAYESGFVDAVRVNQLFADGATVILSGLHERLPKLARFCRALEAAMSCRVQTNIYMTPANSQGFRPHYDSHDVLVLQIEGTKEWRFYDTPVELPLHTQGFNPDEITIGEETDRFVLEPGDMLYVPRGLAHDAIATDKTSLHITTGLMLRSWADVVAEAVNALAHADVDFRRALPPGYANPGADMAAHKPVFDALVAKFAQNAPFEKLMDGFKQEFLTGRVPRVEGQMAEMAKLPSLTENSVVGARPDLIYDLAHLPEDEKIRLACYGAEIIMPDFVEPALRYAVSTARFKIADLPGDLDEAGQLVLIRRLIREGLVVVHQA